MSLQISETGIQDCRIEIQPLFGSKESGVLHILSGGEKNKEWFGGPVNDVYACFSTNNTARGGHYHKVLDEMFITVSGTALWIVSDFRPESPTYKKTAAVVTGWNKVETKHTFPSYTFEELGGLARLRVPAGVYHAVYPLAKSGYLAVALGTTGHVAEDYAYPTLEEVPEMKGILQLFNFL